MRINVCFACDNNYAVHMSVAMASVLKNAAAGDDLFFYILDGGISQSNKEKLLCFGGTKFFNIVFVKADTGIIKKFLYVNFFSYLSWAMYLRFLMSDMLPADISKIIYLDCDTVVCSSMKELFSEDISGYYAAAVEDIGFYNIKRKLNIKYEGFYANSGVMLVNLNLWRKDGISQKLIDYTKRKFNKFVFGDQDAINTVLKDYIKPVNLQWNVQNSFFAAQNLLYHPLKKEIAAAAKKPYVIHYTTADKPWNSYAPYGKQYFKYLKLTEFKINFSFMRIIKTVAAFVSYNIVNFICLARSFLSPLILVRRCGKSFRIELFKRFEFFI